jgi:hypothetical protein
MPLTFMLFEEFRRSSVGLDLYASALSTRDRKRPENAPDDLLVPQMLASRGIISGLSTW